MSIFMPTATTKLINPDGTPASLWILLFNQLLNRVGGSTGGIYSKLLVASGAFSWNMNASPVAFVTLGSGVNTLTATGQVAGNFYDYKLTVIQPSSGADGTITWPSNFFFPGGVTPTLSTGNNAIDKLHFDSDGTNVYLITLGLNYSA